MNSLLCRQDLPFKGAMKSRPLATSWIQRLNDNSPDRRFQVKYCSFTCIDEESSHFAFSDASRSRCKAMLSLVISIPVYIKTVNKSNAAISRMAK